MSRLQREKDYNIVLLSPVKISFLCLDGKKIEDINNSKNISYSLSEESI